MIAARMTDTKLSLKNRKTTCKNSAFWKTMAFLRNISKEIYIGQQTYKRLRGNRKKKPILIFINDQQYSLNLNVNLMVCPAQKLIESSPRNHPLKEHRIMKSTKIIFLAFSSFISTSEYWWLRMCLFQGPTHFHMTNQLLA